MTHQSSWESLANEFEHFGQPLRADWFACEGREDYGIWLLLPDGPDSHKIRASFSLIAARAIEKSGISPKPLPQPQQHDPHWDLYCQLEEEAAQRAGKTIALSDAVPYGLGDVDRDAVDPCSRAWLDLLRAKSPAFRSSEGRSWVKGTECRTYTGSIRSVCEASATFCTLSARDEIEARLSGRLQTDERPAIVIGQSIAAQQRPGKSGKGDETLLGQKRLVSFGTAEQYLGISDRQRQKLISGGALTVEGQGQNRKITTESLKAYLPPEIPN